MSIIKSYLTKAERSKIAYAKEDVVQAESRKKQRRNDWQFAVVLGHYLNKGVMLFAETTRGLVKIQAEVSSAIEKNGALKSGDLVPINTIHCVTLW